MGPVRRTIFEDATGAVLLWEGGGSCLPIPEFGGPLETALWDCSEAPLFLLSDVLSLCIYAHFPDTLAGPGAGHSLPTNWAQ